MRIFSVLFNLVYCCILFGQSPYITEINYDNPGGDNFEYVRVFYPTGVISGQHGILRYNGSNGATYTGGGSVSISCNPIAGGEMCTYLWTGSGGLQNGNPDGVALVKSTAPTAVIQFISYGGSFTATNGLASGMTSSDIVVTENDSSPDLSMQFNGVSWFTGPPTLAPLAVDLSKMILTKLSNTFIVSWSTLSETNNSHFTIDHSTDGKIWSEIGRVEAALERNNEKDYAFEHDNPAQGINYYKLNQFDLDGTKTSFDVLAGFMNTSKEDYLFPTITHDKIYLSSGKEGLVKIFDATGKMVVVQNYHPGNAINVDNLSKGQYFLNHSESTHPFIKE